MKYYLLIVVLYCLACQNKPHTEAGKHENVQPISKSTNTKKFQNGDIIFQISASGQGRAIQLATHSLYTHCGIVYTRGEEVFVLEAIQPVVITPLPEWIARGEKRHFVVKRLKNADKILTNVVLKRMQNYGKSLVGKPYDIYFGWGDDRIYCSELVWKIYQHATGLELGKRQRLQDFDLEHPEIKQLMQARYGNQIPYKEFVISPAGIMDSDLLETVNEAN